MPGRRARLSVNCKSIYAVPKYSSRSNGLNNRIPHAETEYFQNKVQPEGIGQCFLPNDVQPSHDCLENGLPSNVSTGQGGGGRGGGQDEDDHTQETAVEGAQTEQTQDTGDEHEQTGSDRQDGADGEDRLKVQTAERLDEGQGGTDTPHNVDQANDHVDKSFCGFLHSSAAVAKASNPI